MLEQQAINFITTPLMAGAVGYLTNKLAIKMLFRPYQPKWYTLGWQGIVPKTRPKLAEKISKIVSGRLLSHDDFLYALENNNITSKINNIISLKLQNITEKEISLILKLIKPDQKIVDNQESINHFISSLLDNIINSNSSLKEILPKNLLSKKHNLIEYVTIKIMANIKKLGRDKDIQKIFADKIINFKNNMFSTSNSNMDMLKVGFLNLFINDEKIENTIEKELPNIADDLSSNMEIYKKIYNNIENEMDNFLDKPIKDVLEVIEINNLVNIDVVNIIKSDNYKKIKLEVIHKLSLFIQNNYLKISSIITNILIKLIKNNLQDILKAINIENIIKDKINSLELPEVENMLFSFMKEHFKWINLLGFIIGFFIGLIQVMAVYLAG